MISETLSKPPESNAQVQEYMTAVRKGLNNQFVVATSKGWSVRLATEPAEAVVFASKTDAIRKAKDEVKAKKGEVFIFGQNGALIGHEVS